MFSKLALRNVRRSFRDYGVYLLTLTFGVCLFYTFNSVEGQGAMVYLSQSQNPVAESIRILIDVFSVFVAVVLACLIVYANGFLLRRRKRELGTYLLLGMGRGQVARLLLLETAGMGLLALLVGLGLGALAAWGLSAFTAGLFAVPMTMFTFSVSPSSLGKTALAFAAIFLLVMAYHAFAVSRCKLIELMQAQQVNQELKSQSLGVSVLLFLAGVALLLVAYAMLLTRGILVVDALFWVMIGLGSLGTLLFFRSLSGFLLRVCRSRKKLYYKNLNMFVLRQFNARINTTYRSMTVICLMLLLAVGITASAVGLNNTVEQMAEEELPQDASLLFYPDGEEPADLPALLAEGGFDPEAECAFSLAVPVYRTGEERAITQSMHDAIAGRWGQDAAYAFRAHHGLDVQPDDAAQGAHIDGWYFLADYAGDKYAAEARFQEALSTLNTLGVYGCTTRIGTWMEVMGTKVLVLFIGLYLGVVFLLASAAVLALQQLTQAADNAPRYQLLARLGAPERMRARSVDIQVFLSFFLPLALALVHAAVGMTAANAVIAEVGKVDAAASSAVAAVLLLVIYGGYFLATCWGSRQIVRGG